MASSSRVNLLLPILIGGFTLAFTQNHQFRIQVYDDYPEYHDYQDVQSVAPPPPPPAPIHRAPVQHAPVQVQIPLKKETKDKQDFSKIPGIPGIDYPLYHQVPETSFSCSHVPYVPGMYANPETGCQAYHVCHDGREGHQGAAFLCSNGTLFNQKEFACDWWYNVNCAEATKLYGLNGDLASNPFVPKERKDAIERERLRIAVF